MSLDDTIGGMLSDNDIRSFWGKGIEVTSNEKGIYEFILENQLQFGSIDLRFQRQYYRFSNTVNNVTFESTKNKEYLVPGFLKNDEQLVLNPGEIILTSTAEIINFSKDFAGLITGRSSIARLGIMVQCCQDFINPGHGQSIALQLINLSKNTVVLDRSVPICPLVIFKLRTPASNAYQHDKTSKYSGNALDTGTTKIYEEAKESAVSPDSHTDKSPEILKFFKKVIHCIEPLFPSIIMLIFISPWITNVSGKSITDLLSDFIQGVFNGLVNLQAGPVIGAIVLLFYFISRWRNDKDE